MFGHSAVFAVFVAGCCVPGKVVPARPQWLGVSSPPFGVPGLEDGGAVSPLIFSRTEQADDRTNIERMPDHFQRAWPDRRTDHVFAAARMSR